MRCLPIILVLLFSCFHANSQEMLGLTNTRYSGIYGAILNPATPVLSPYYLDINLLAAGVFAENNYLYLAKEEYQFRRFLNTNPDFPTHPPDNKFYYDYYNPEDKKGFINGRVIGPSAALVAGRNAYGFYSNARTAVSFRNIPWSLAKFFYEGLTYPPQYDIRYVHNQKMRVAGLSWGEMALNYSRMMQNRGYDFLALGITLKSLHGFAGAYANSELVDYMVPDRDTLIIYNTISDGGFSLPLDYANNNFLPTTTLWGKGIGIDMGVVFEHKKLLQNNTDNFRRLCSQTYVPYQYRIGISILDLGWIRFKEHAIEFEAKNAGLIWPGINEEDFENVNTVVADVSNRFFGNPTQLISDNDIRIGLPTALSVQSDLNVWKNIYVNSAAVVPLKLMKNTVIRPALIALGSRFESRLLSIGAVASIYDWTRFHYGLNVRLGTFYIGTENLGGFFKYRDFTGLDIYGGVKLSFHKGNCKSNNTVSCDNNEYKKFKVRKSGKRKRN